MQPPPPPLEPATSTSPRYALTPQALAAIYSHLEFQDRYVGHAGVRVSALHGACSYACMDELDAHFTFPRFAGMLGAG